MSYKLIYYDGTNKAESIRLLFSLAKVPFEDYRFKHEEWPTLKPTLKYGQVPVLYIGDKQLAQSNTILRFLAKKYNLTGENEWEAACCDELVDSANDLITEWYKFNFCADAAKKEEAKTTLLNTTIPKYFGIFNTMQKENGGNFLVGKSVTWADVHVSNVLSTIDASLGNYVLIDYPNLKNLTETVFAIPGIKTYLDSRPKK